MFGSKKKGGAIEVAKLSSLIADNLHIVGDVHFSGGLRVDGRIEGNVYGKPGGKGLLVLSEKGSITGKVHAYDAVINGNITGDIDIEHFLELQASANVAGNLRYRQLQMDCGATVDGKLMRVHDEARTISAEATALPESVGGTPSVLRSTARTEPAGLPGIEPRPASSRAAPARTEPSAASADPAQEKVAAVR